MPVILTGADAELTLIKTNKNLSAEPQTFLQENQVLVLNPLLIRGCCTASGFTCKYLHVLVFLNAMLNKNNVTY